MRETAQVLVFVVILHLVYSIAGESNQSTSPVDYNCPTWQYYDITSERCKCGDDLHGVVQCNDTTNEVRLLHCYCMGVNDNGQMQVGKCFASCASFDFQSSHNRVYHHVPNDKLKVNTWLCDKLNKNGRFCGECQNGFSPVVYSYDIRCQKCKSSPIQNIIMFIAAVFGPLTVFYILVVVMKISAASPHLFSYVMFTQWLSEPMNIRSILRATQKDPKFNSMIGYLLTTYSIWNLDFFRALYPPICLDIKTSLMLALDYLPAFYILILILITYLLIKLHSCNFRVVACFSRPIEYLLAHIERRWTGNTKSSIVNAFSTFFLLSYIRLLSVTLTLLSPTMLYDIHGNKTATGLYYDASIEYFGKEHLPYAVLAILVLLTFVICPFLFVTLYPFKWFQRCLNACRIKNQAIHTFADSFLGWFKNGTERGERDCRFVMGLHLGLRIALLSMCALTLSPYSYAVIAGAMILFSMVILFVRPYKDQWDTYNKVDPSAMLLTALWCVTVLAFIIVATMDILSYKYVYFSAVLSFIVATIPLVCMVGVLSYKILKRSSMLNRGMSLLKRKMCIQCTDYESLNDSDDVDIIQF